MENAKRSKIILAYCLFYVLVVIFGGAVNTAANVYDGQQFGHFLQSFIGSFYGVFIFALFIIALTALKQLKGKDTLLNEKVFNFLLAGVMLWVFLSCLYSFIGYINSAAQYGEYDIEMELPDSSKGSLAITCLNFAGVIALFVALKFWKVIGAYFKGFGLGKKQAAPAVESQAAVEVKADESNPAEEIVADVSEETSAAEETPAAEEPPEKEEKE